jgi:hypothetical protein
MPFVSGVPESDVFVVVQPQAYQVEHYTLSGASTRTRGLMLGAKGYLQFTLQCLPDLHMPSCDCALESVGTRGAATSMNVSSHFMRSLAENLQNCRLFTIMSVYTEDSDGSGQMTRGIGTLSRTWDMVCREHRLRYD